MATTIYLNVIMAGSEHTVYHSAILLLTLVGIQQLLCEYGIEQFRRVTLNAISISITYTTNARENRHVIKSALQGHTAIPQTFSQEICLFSAQKLSTKTV